jgi:hypothetical protein
MMDMVKFRRVLSNVRRRMVLFRNSARLLSVAIRLYSVQADKISTELAVFVMINYFFRNSARLGALAFRDRPTDVLADKIRMVF